MYMYLFEYSHAVITSGCSSSLSSFMFVPTQVVSLMKACRTVKKRMKTKTMTERMILERTVMKEMKREPPMTIQLNPMIRAEKVLVPFKSRKGNPDSKEYS